MCNHAFIEDLGSYINMVSKNDAIVFYTINMTQAQSRYLISLFESNDVYFIIKNNTEEVKTICSNQWLNLVNQYHSTMTWK
jgi:hypothetical protein